MLSFLEGGGAAAAAIRAHDWWGSPIGEPDTWPSVLKTTVSLILASRFPQCIIWGPSLIAIPNDAFLPILGDKPAALGRTLDEIWAEIWPSLEPIVAKAFAGEPTFIEDWPLTIDRRGYLEPACFTFCYSPIRDERGQVVGILDTVTETTEKVALYERQRLLAGELGHRLKNLLTVVQAICSQTLRRAPDLKEANRLLSLRLSTIGRASDVLTASQWTDADLHDLVRTAAEAHWSSAERLTMRGPPMRFTANVALALALAFHELATNAAKYGAFSNDAGRVDLDWTVDNGRFQLEWREKDGPAVQPPARRGFGSVMIEQALKGYLRGDVSISYDPAGVVFRIDAALDGARA